MDGELKDRIGKYLIPKLDEYIFDELSGEYLEKAGLSDILSGVPVPIKKTEIAEITNLRIAHSMAVVIGADINFKYKENYIDYIERTFGEDFNKMLIAQGVDTATAGDYLQAAILFRAVIQLDPESQDAVYCYGRACRDAYGDTAANPEAEADGEEFTGRFKAESLEAFERLVRMAPDFSMGYYFLAYAYLNLGLYTKAGLSFDKFMELTGEGEDVSVEGQRISDMRREIKDWQRKLEDPIRIEEGYNMVLSGRYEEGVDILAPFRDDEGFNKWWPLWYYLGVAERELGDYSEAVSCQLEVLKLSPSNQDAMKELAELYEMMGDSGSADKYREKIKIVDRNREEYRAEKYKDYS